ncbi:hypothetical protein [Streptomyces sp. NPDC059533]|uniref:hypothetical protein n=1 Tax=unclassified Streptomyces TaxID=2593676 RepID=UPI0036A4C8C6
MVDRRGHATKAAYVEPVRKGPAQPREAHHARAPGPPRLRPPRPHGPRDLGRRGATTAALEALAAEPQRCAEGTAAAAGTSHRGAGGAGRYEHFRDLALWCGLFGVVALVALVGYGRSPAGMTRAQRTVRVVGRIERVGEPRHGSSPSLAIPVVVSFRDPSTGEEFTVTNGGDRGDRITAA